jgi:glycosyltransferase involved in cell wall biosynthesis
MLNFYAPINTLGYGIHAYNLIKAYCIEYPDVEISLIPPYGDTRWRDVFVDDWLARREKISKLDTGIMIFNEPFLSQFSGALRIGFPVFEMEQFTPLSVAMMKTCDWLLTPSQWGRGVLERETKIPDIDVVPEGYDPLVFHPDYSLEFKLDRIERRGLNFIHIGKWESRKGTSDIFKAFLNTFEGGSKKATLTAYIGNIFNANWPIEVAKCLGTLCYSSTNPQGDVLYERGGARVRVLKPSSLSFKQMASLYRDADFGIWLSKAEGWNLPLMECIACGTPSVTTDWTGMSEYLGEYPTELKVTKFRAEVANDGTWFKGDRGNWRVPDMKQVQDILCNIRDNPEKYLRLEEKCTKAIEKFTWRNAAIKLNEVLKKIGG